MKRPSWNEYFMNIARAVATRATCDRKLVGAVIVDSNHCILSTGYNGAPRGAPHCDDVGHDLVEIDGRESCIRSLHAESNALDELRGGHCTFLYVTVMPCYECAKRIVNSGIEEVYYGEEYRSRNADRVMPLFESAGVGVYRAG